MKRNSQSLAFGACEGPNSGHSNPAVQVVGAVADLMVTKRTGDRLRPGVKPDDMLGVSEMRRVELDLRSLNREWRPFHPCLVSCRLRPSEEGER